MNYKDISISDLCFYLIGKGDTLKFSVLDDWMKFSKSDMYAFIEDKTGNFDINKFKYFMETLRAFDMPFNITYENGKIEEHPELMFVYNLVIKNKNESLIERINAVQIKYNEGSVYKEGSVHPICTTLLEDFSEMAEAEYKRITESTSAENKPKLNEIKQPKQPLSFTGLFKPEYVVKIDMFYSRLIANGYIDKNHIWRPSKENEPAKVYFWLFDKGVLKYNTPTPALICFCKEFGITAYKDTEQRPSAEIRAVTVKNLLNATLTKDEKNHFENVFLPFIIK